MKAFINAISINAANKSVTAHMDIMIHMFTISRLQPPFIMRQLSQTLSAKAAEYARNSSHVNGKRNNIKNAK